RDILALRVRPLVVQPAQHTARRGRHVSLYEVGREAVGLELVAVERFEEIAAIVSEHLRLDHHASRQVGLHQLHGTYPRSPRPSRYWPYPFLASGLASASSCASSIQPLFQAISSGQ